MLTMLIHEGGTGELKALRCHTHLTVKPNLHAQHLGH